MKQLLALLKDQSGTTAIEYTLIASGICTGNRPGYQNVGAAVNADFTKVQNGFK
jgi:Flp pilus assembly pilin Flp